MIKCEYKDLLKNIEIFLKKWIDIKKIIWEQNWK